MFLGDNIYNSLTPKMFTGDNRNQSPPNRVQVLVIESLAVNVLIVKVLYGQILAVKVLDVEALTVSWFS